jgi:hypothetical protein
MIRIRIEHDVVALPQPVAHVVVIVRRHLEEVPADVEPLAPAAAQPPDVRGPNRPLKPPMLPRMIEMVVRIIAPRVVSYPTVILRVNVRRLRMSLLIPVSPPLLSLLRRRLSAPILLAATLLATPLLTSIIALLLLLRRSPHRLRPALRDMPLANSFLAPAALLLSLLTSLLPLLPTLLLLLASFLRKDSRTKRRHSKHHHHRNQSRKNSRKPFHTLLQSTNPNEIRAEEETKAAFSN